MCNRALKLTVRGVTDNQLRSGYRIFQKGEGGGGGLLYASGPIQNVRGGGGGGCLVEEGEEKGGGGGGGCNPPPPSLPVSATATTIRSLATSGPVQNI